MAFVTGEGGAKVITPSPTPVSAEAPGGATTRPGSLTASWEEGSSLLSTQPHPLTAEAEPRGDGPKRYFHPPIPKYIFLSCPKALTCSLMSQSFLTGCRSVHLTFEVRLQGPYLSPPTPRQRDLLCRPPGHASNPSPHHPHGHPLHVSAEPRPRTRLPAPALSLWSVPFLRAQRSSPNTNLNKAPPSQNPSLPPRCSRDKASTSAGSSGLGLCRRPR